MWPLGFKRNKDHAKNPKRTVLSRLTIPICIGWWALGVSQIPPLIQRISRLCPAPIKYCGKVRLAPSCLRLSPSCRPTYSIFQFKSLSIAICCCIRWCLIWAHLSNALISLLIAQFKVMKWVKVTWKQWIYCQCLSWMVHLLQMMQLELVLHGSYDLVEP